MNPAMETAMNLGMYPGMNPAMNPAMNPTMKPALVHTCYGSKEGWGLHQKHKVPINLHAGSMWPALIGQHV